MKATILTAVSLILVSLIFGQETASVRVMRFGIGIGSNKSYTRVKRSSAEDMLIVERFAFRMGVNFDARISEKIALSPKLEMAFYNTEIGLANAENNKVPYKVSPVALELAGHVRYTPFRSHFAPYLLAGPKFSSSLYLPKSHNEFETEPNFSLEIGLGFEKALPKFNMLPELRYAFGFSNINGHPELESVKMNTLTLFLILNS